MNRTNIIENQILGFAADKRQFNISEIVGSLGLNFNSVNQYLNRLLKNNKLERVERGVYCLRKHSEFKYSPPEFIKDLYHKIKNEFPFGDFCIYDGSVFNTLTHHVSINNAIYIETNREGVDILFNYLKGQDIPVYKQPDAKFIYDYINLKNQCIIINALISEAPIHIIEDIPTPTLEKLLVDILRDKDLDYLRGVESNYIYERACDQFAINKSRLLRYARRRGCVDEVISLTRKIVKNDR